MKYAYVYKNIDDSIKNIKNIYTIQKERIKFLEEENKYLKDKNYKDLELLKLKEKLEEMRQNLIRGFEISKEDDEKIKMWRTEHIRKKHWNKKEDRPAYTGAIGGSFSYHFIPTSIGVIGTIKCTCGEEFCFQNI